MKRRKLRLLFYCLAMGALISSCKTITCGCPMAGEEIPENSQYISTRQAPERIAVAAHPQKPAVRRNSW